MGCLTQFTVVLLYFVPQVESFLDIHELEEAKYGLEILNTPMALRQEVENAVDVVSKYGQAYRCSLPVFEDEKQTNNEGKTRENEMRSSESEGMSTSDVIRQLLSPMKGACLTKTKGWWTYQFCYGKDIKQYHLEGREVLGDVVYLGHYSSEEEWTKDKEEEMKKKKFAPRFHSQMYLNGTVCDINNKPRQAQVKFLCENGVGDYIARIDEPRTCQYVIHVHTTHICHHPFFRQSQSNKARPIRCSPLLEDKEYDLHMKQMEEEQKSNQEQMEKLAKQKLDEAFKEETTLPYDSGPSSSDAEDMEPLYEAGDEDAAARQHEAAYDKAQKQTATTANKEKLTDSETVGDFFFKVLNLKNKKEKHSTTNDGASSEDEDEDKDNPLRMDKVFQRVMNLLSELKEDASDKTDETGMRKKNEKEETDQTMDEEKADDQAETMVDDKNKWKVRVRKVSQEDANEVGEKRVEDGEEPEEEEFFQMLEKTKKELEKMIKKGLEEAGVKPEGDVQVKFITTNGRSLSGVTDGVHSLSDEENEELHRLLGNRVGEEREEARQNHLESNYEKVWNKKHNSKETESKRSSTDQRNEN